MRRIYIGVFLTSAAVLLLEISLTRIFSYTIWYHFTYVTISLAMLGFGASGAVLAASESLGDRGMRLAQHSSFMGAVSVPVMLIIMSTVPFHPFQIFKEPVQLFYMILYYLAVTAPFFCAGMTISCAFKNMPRDASKIYFADLVGAGIGCFVVVIGINLFGVPAVSALCASLFLLASVLFLPRESKLTGILMVAAAVIWIPLGSNVEKALEFKAGKEKLITGLAEDGLVFSKWSPIFRVDISKSKPAVPSYERAIYGIGNNYLPSDMESAFIAHDGDACTRMIKSDRDLSPFGAFERSVLKTPYVLKQRSDVLIIGPGGGVDVAVALKNEARSVLAVELDPITVDIVANTYADYVGYLYDRPEVRVVADEGRSFLRRTDEKFDLIQMTGVDTLAALSSGAYVLAENYLYTVEAYCDFMDRLNPDGIFCLATRDYHFNVRFPRFVTRQISLSVDALRERGITEPWKDIAVIAARKGGMPWLSIMTKMSPFTPSEVARLTKFAEDLSFDIWHLPGRSFNNPPSRMATATESERADYYRRHPLQLRAPTDENPFYFHFYKWATLLKEHEVDLRHTMATGQLILILILILSVVFSAVLIIYPLLRFQRGGLQTGATRNYILYFAALGLGFIFIEISYIQRFILFLGYPTYSLTVILFSLLTFSGIGSYLSGRLPLNPGRLILIAVALLAIVALGYLILLPPIFNHFLGAPQETRIAISLLLLLPLGLLLGMFFPTGIKILSDDHSRFVPWAWGINGCASVIGTVLSIIIAMTYGFRAVTILAVIIYIVGVGAMYSVTRKNRPDNA